ncbi:MAG: CHASE2 domain-containing protein [Treponema sp.]
MKKKIYLPLIIIPCVIGVMSAGLYLFPWWVGAENRLYDVFLSLKSEVREDQSIVLLDIDDISIEKVGLYPWPRNTIAKGLEALTQLGAAYAVFDIEYIDKSPMSIDSVYLNGALKSEFNTSFEEIGANVQDIFAALANNQITLPEAGIYGNELVNFIDEARDNLYRQTEQVAVENDSYLGKAMRLFGPTFVTVNMQPYPPQEGFQSLYEIARNRFVYPHIQMNMPLSGGALSALIPIPEISGMAAGAGFTNVHIDSDGVRRRIRLFDHIDNTVFMQLAFSPLLHKLNSPQVMLHKNRIILKDAVLNGKLQNITIPLDSDGMMLIRWPKKNYQQSFTHIPFYLLIEYDESGETTATHLRLLRANAGWNLGPGYAGIDACIRAWTESEHLRRTALESGAEKDKTAWLNAVKQYWTNIEDFLAADYGTSIPALFDYARDAGNPEDAQLYNQVKEDFEKLYANVAQSYTNHIELERRLSSTLKNAFCIIGWSSTGTTDIGVNPFHSEYVNVGTHAAVANTILQKDFLRQAPIWVSQLSALILAFGIILIIRPFNTLVQIIAGFVLSAVLLIANYLIFSITGTYVFIGSPLLALFMSFLTYSLASFVLSEREKNFLRKAFGTYLSGDVINEIIEDPSMLKLGGQKKWITAMFTDVRGFSTISEALDAEQLVKLLNIYLSGMSDIILEQRGTIDKYEGDAIISFFGAPVDYSEHARLACRAAVLMKRKEAELNELFMREGMSPNPLLTRIGINTGDMVVGNMGTERKMDYTIMGNAVNLAARLEGVNKQYGTWLLISDMTKNEIGDEFVTRRLDRVRVVGINTPVQLWELVELKDSIDSKTGIFLQRFEQAHRAFDERNWRKAAQMFKILLQERPNDGPSDAYLKKCEAFIQKPPAENWDGVFSLTQK